MRWGTMSDIKEIIGDLIMLWDLLKPRISCQTYLTERNEEKALFDLQIVGLWVQRSPVRGSY